MKDKNQYLVALNNEVNQILADSMKFYPNVPDPEDQDPVEQLEYMESIVNKKQFVLMQFIKIYTVLWTDWIEGKVDVPRILMAMEIALKGKKVPLNKRFIRKQNIPKKIKEYFHKYGEIYK